MPNSVRERFISKLKSFKRIEPVPRLSNVYTTFNEVLLDVRYSGLNKSGNYWFYVDTYRVNEWRGKQRFVECLICGDADTVAIIPDDELFEWFKDVKPNRKGHWLLTIMPRDGVLMMRITGRPPIKMTDYLNRYDFISHQIPRPTLVPTSATAQQGRLDVEQLILANDDLHGNSVHEKVIDMLHRVGGWAGYSPRKSYKAPADSAYEIDVVWLRNDMVDVAVEVQVSGNETEAKDRLIHARRFGARKVIVVTSPRSIARLKSICRYEPELKNWLEIWSIAKIYDMFLAGSGFFELFRPFERQAWSEEIREVL